MTTVGPQRNPPQRPQRNEVLSCAPNRDRVIALAR
jgi:hypothetical protein